MLHRFYSASNGDISSLVASIKKTIRWRETYRILSEEELEEWSDVVFWHGVDMQHRPCLIVRLGLGCCVLPSRDRPRFAQAISMFLLCNFGSFANFPPMYALCGFGFSQR